ncbi:hypothetical protein AAP_02654 [Ascosphaera apis ARSEF 7405]|uniref:Uncharacterized protein n=1 Tax=Ascosphaera apis ARSEF 7405 TaxID=392613 RepID=A0A167ZWM2_9EURO|nr:hypothetical protein AAP_02654 [Ascosphaera apis ARSEF 7405]
MLEPVDTHDRKLCIMKAIATNPRQELEMLAKTRQEEALKRDAQSRQRVEDCQTFMILNEIPDRDEGAICERRNVLIDLNHFVKVLLRYVIL